MDERRWVAAPVSRRGLAVGDLDRDGLPVVQICPNPRCRRDYHRPWERCRACGTLLARPLEVAGEDVEDDHATALEPADEPDPEQLDEASGGAPVLGLWARWVWLAAGLAQHRRSEARSDALLRRAEARFGAMVMELVRES